MCFGRHDIDIDTDLDEKAVGRLILIFANDHPFILFNQPSTRTIINISSLSIKSLIWSRYTANLLSLVKSNAAFQGQYVASCLYSFQLTGHPRYHLLHTIKVVQRDRREMVQASNKVTTAYEIDLIDTFLPTHQTATPSWLSASQWKKVNVEWKNVLLHTCELIFRRWEKERVDVGNANPWLCLTIQSRYGEFWGELQVRIWFQLDSLHSIWAAFHHQRNQLHVRLPDQMGENEIEF